MRALGAGLVLLVAVALPAPALGQRGSVEWARHHNARARALFLEGRFEEAAEHYLKAYRARPVPEFLHNAAQCYRRLSTLAHLELALRYFERYLERAPQASNRREVEEEAGDLRRRIAVIRRAAPPEAPRPARPAPALVEHGAAARPAHTVSPPFYKTWWFWTVVGVVVVGATTATAVALQPEPAEPVVGTMPPGSIGFELGARP